MPAPQPDQLGQIAKSLFKAKAISIPPSWDPSLQDLYNMKKGEFAPGVPKPTAIFAFPSVNKIALDACNTISDGFEGFIDDAASAICGCWSTWQSSVKFVGVIINAGVGMLNPGGLIGGGNMAGPMILAKFAQKGPNYVKYANAVANAIGTAWTTWELGYSNLAIPFPGGMACSSTMPPSPNTPVPLASGVSPGDSMMQADTLKGAMIGNLGGPGEHSEALFDCIAQAFAQTFMTWKGTSMITQIMGSGGVAPPPPAPPGPVAGAVGSGGSLS
jgi:hypothetical protein